MNASRHHPCPLNEQAVGWALHALEPDEEMAVLLHVPQCSSCQAAVRDAEEVLSHLGGLVEQADPPPALRDRIVSAAADIPRQPVAPAPVSRSVPQPRHRLVDRDAAERPPHDTALPRRRASWLTRRRLVTASVALIGVLAIGGLAVRTTQLEQQSETLTAQAQTIADLVGQLNRPGVPRAILAADGGATTAAVVLADGQRQVYTVGLAANPSDRTYVLWGVRDNTPTALGTFDVTTADGGVRTVGAVGANEGYTAYAISIEPGRSAPASPSEVVAQGKVEV